MRGVRQIAALVGVAAAAGGGAASCAPGPSCAAGDGACEEITTCAGLAYGCAADQLYVGSVADAPGGLGLAGGQGVGGDLVLRNAQVTAVFDALDTPHDLAPTGGNLLDLGPTGGRDELPSLYQIAGILPDDAFAYHSLRVIDESPERVALLVRGTLDGRPEVPVVTRWELRACEPGLRVRSELVNRSPDPLPLVLADTAHWGKRNALPFAPQEGQGFWQPELELVELADSYFAHDYVVARPAEDDAPSYGFVGCDRDRLDGVNDTEVSALGTPFTLVKPGEALVVERFVLAAGGRDLAGAVDEVARARAMLHGDPPAREVTGRVMAGGMPVAGSVRRAAVLVLEGGRPLTMVVPDGEGRFTARVAAGGELGYQVWSFGRPVATGTFGGGDAGDIEIAQPGELVVSVVDGTGAPIHAVVALHPADRAGRDALTGSWFGRFDSCAPWLGPPVGGSPACNRAVIGPEGAGFEVPAGRYQIWATAGPEHALAMAEREIGPGEVVDLELAVAALDIRPAGFLSADLHVHGQASFDSSLPDRDRVLTFVAAGIDVVAATDHDVVTDYADAVREAALGDRVAVMGGLETTGLIPFMDIPDDDLPKVIGHFNFWPLVPDPAAPRRGAPWDELVEPGELMDRMAALTGEGGVAMMNHPWDERQFGRDLGYLRAIKFDPREPIPPEPDGSRNGMLVRAPGGGRRNVDFDLVEIQNGAHVEQVVKARPLWFSLLGQGFVRPGTASSDSHSLADAQLGYGRTLAETGGDLAGFEPAAFNRALREGRILAGNGVLVLVSIASEDGSRRGVSLEPHRLAAGDRLEIEVRAPPWMPVTEVRVVTARGERVVASGGDLEHPADPLGTAGVVRWQGSLPLADLVAAGGDDWIVVEAGLPLFETADLDDDGVPDTTDNDGDGDIDEDDVEDPDDDTGPLRQPADPDDDPDDPRFAMTRVVPRAWSHGFTGPLLIDGDGGGWDPPGLAP
ncbi:MAG TPA: CehA/McbA family metallohydrolase [Kofleriaceae bacterium]|nr:CehA/McbA family metallohydrolase [Kofleriaceae bacterium]